MNNLSILKNNLSVILNAEKELFSGLALYKFKALFDGLVIVDNIDFCSEYGELLLICLRSKRKNEAMKHIVFARSSLESTIKSLELEKIELDKKEEKQDNLAIESTCIVVTDNEKEEVQLNDIPKKLGRPKSKNALSGAQRAKKARDKKKANKLITVNSTLNADSSVFYTQMIKSGYDLNSIIAMSYVQYSLSKP